jgi:hypothetical protein
LCASEFKHRLHIRAEEGGLECHLLWVILPHQSLHTLEDVAKLVVRVANLMKVYIAQDQRLWLPVDNLD